jgi:hypothetical protein
MAPRRCRVSYTTSDAVTVSVEVVAESIYEAGLRGLVVLERHAQPFGIERQLTITTLDRPIVRRTVTVHRLRFWLHSPRYGSSAEGRRKDACRALFPRRPGDRGRH